MLLIDYHFTNARGVYAQIMDIDSIDGCIKWLEGVREEMRKQGKSSTLRLDFKGDGADGE